MELGPHQRASAWRAFLATALLTTAAAALAERALSATAGAPAPDALVAAGTLGAGAVAAATLAVGCAMLAVTSLTSRFGRSWARAEALARHLVPLLLRRALAVGIGAGVSLGLGTSALADEVDVSWQVTGDTEATAPPTAEPDPGPDLGHPRPEPEPTTVASPAPGLQEAAATDPVASAARTAPADPRGTADPHITEAATPDPTAPTEQTTGRTEQGERADQAPLSVTVRPGDSLWGITAEILGEDATPADVADAWPRLYEANRDLIGPDPDLIHPGVVLAVPTGIPA